MHEWAAAPKKWFYDKSRNESAASDEWRNDGGTQLVQMEKVSTASAESV